MRFVYMCVGGAGNRVETDMKGHVILLSGVIIGG